jgi:hypothetical protein
MLEASRPSYRCIALVAGYHPCSFPPSPAHDVGLKERFAVVLSSFRPEKKGMFFDADLFVIIADAILRLIPHDALEIDMGVQAPALRSLRELTERYGSQDEMDRDPPPRIRVHCGGRLVAIEETELWAQVGGPAPYHDSFTMSFYTAENRAVEFRHICEALANENDVIITAFHEALSH